MKSFALAVLAAAFLAESGAVASEPVSFSESTAALLPGDTATPFYSGVAMGVVDLDGDGRDDIVRFRLGRGLQIESQTAPGAPFASFTGTTFSSLRVAVAVADVDGSGRRDLACIGYTGGLHLLTAHTPGPGFSLSLLPDDDIVGQGLNFTDLDGDGQSDLFACDDIDDNQKYRNDGTGAFAEDDGLIDTFLAAEAGQDFPNAGNYAALWTDYDNDGDTDMFLAKCRQGEHDAGQRSRINRLFRREADGRFTDVAAAAGLASGAQSWCADFADVDNDGDLDAFVLNHVVVGSDAPSAFYLNNGDGTFTDATAASGITTPFFGIQACFRDFNNDGHVDLLVSSTGGGYRLYRNEGDGSFTDQPNVLTTTQTGTGTPLGHLQSFAVGDLNGDGWLDLYAGRSVGLNNPTSTPANRDRLFLNDGGANHFLQVRLAGKMSNPDALGARLELHGAWGVQVREVRSGEGYGVMHSLTQHFGLGTATEIDRLVVRWPSGCFDVVPDPEPDQVIALTEGESPPTFEEWRALVFSETDLLDPAISGPNANPDGDALENLFEWYFRTKPKDARSTRDPVAFTVEETTPGERRLVLTVARRRIPGVLETAEVTGDFETWSRGAPAFEILLDTEDTLVLRTPPAGASFAAVRLVIGL